jgi:hypothetical protein
MAITRRAALGAVAVLCAPAVVRAESLMLLRGAVLPTLPIAPLLGPPQLILGLCDRLKWRGESGILQQVGADAVAAKQIPSVRPALDNSLRLSTQHSPRPSDRPAHHGSFEVFCGQLR